MPMGVLQRRRATWSSLVAVVPHAHVIGIVVVPQHSWLFAVQIRDIKRAGNTIGDGTQEGHAVLEECGKDGAADVVGVCLWWDHTCWRMQWCGTWSQMGIVAITGA